MPEIIPTPGDRTVVVNRFGILTIISLGFNALILLLLLIGLVCHHHHRHQHHGDRGEFSRDGGGRGYGEDGMRFHHHGFGGMRPGWGGGGPGFGRDENRGGWNQGEERGPQGEGFHGGAGGPGGFPGGPGGLPGSPGGFPGAFGALPGHPGGMGGGAWMKQPPTAASLTDHIMQHLTGQLTLTDAETAQIRPVVEQQVAQLQKDMETQHQALQKSVDDTTAKIRPMLTPDQQKQLDQLKASVEQKMAKPGEPAAPATAPK